MLDCRTSIRQKITLTYSIVIAATVGLSIVAFFALRLMEKKIIFWEVTSTLFDTMLEIRRFEKNFFLYGQDSDFTENMNFIERAQDILASNEEKYKTLEVHQQLDAMKRELKQYKELMEKFHKFRKQKNTNIQPLEMTIKESGKKLITIAENISKFEWKQLQLYLKETVRNLVISIAALSLIGIMIGQILSKMVVRPLKALENRMKLIAEGRLEKVIIDSKDREIVSLTNAFNKMLKELEVRQRHLVQSEKLASLGTLLSGVAHELNNPLSNISSSSQILSEELEESDMEYKKELLAQIDEQIERSRKIVRSLLEFSREKDFKKEELPLKRLFEDTIRFVKGQLPTGLTISIDIPDDIAIFSDKQRIQQAFLNLIRNAIEATAEEGKITIVARQVIGEETLDFVDSVLVKECIVHTSEINGRDAVYVKICDTGTGIPPDVLSKIFDPFFTTKDVGKGSGLGLFIVHEIIEEHGGSIAVDSQVGIGTTFLIRLPLSRISEENISSGNLPAKEGLRNDA